MTAPIRIAQISDMHCYRVTLSPTQFFSKRWVGNFNVIFNRRLKYYADPNSALISLFEDLGIKHLVISGDLTTTALPKEFEASKQFTDQVNGRGIMTHLVPGNHDNYTRKSKRDQVFYQYFENEEAHGFVMKRDKVAVRPLGSGWWFVGIDTTLPTPLLSSIGRFTPEIEEALERALASIPEGDQVVLVNHFPMFSTIHHSHDMRGCDALRAQLIRWPNVKLYLHGHVHKQSITDHRASGLPIILNSGSCGFKRRATFHTIDLEATGCNIGVYAREPQGRYASRWVLREKARFRWG